jgi:ribosome maturation factor RimP
MMKVGTDRTWGRGGAKRRSATQTSVPPENAKHFWATFERTLDAIAHDAAFAPLEIVRHEAHPARGSSTLVVTIDRPGGVDLALCERVAARINASLEGLETNYELEVESAGLERPLMKPADFERFAGAPARIVTTLAIDGVKTHRGMLRGLRGENVVLDTDAGELLLPPAIIRSARLEYDPRADLRKEKRERKGSHGFRDGH